MFHRSRVHGLRSDPKNRCRLRPKEHCPNFRGSWIEESVPRSSSLLRCAPCPAFVGRRATPKALPQGASAWAPWNKWKGPTRVKRRWEGGRLCRERPWRLRLQRYGSQVGERRNFRWRHLWEDSSEGPSHTAGTRLPESRFVTTPRAINSFQQAPTDGYDWKPLRRARYPHHLDRISRTPLNGCSQQSAVAGTAGAAPYAGS